MIVRVKNGWIVKSESGKNLSKVLKSKHEAHKRLAEVEFFKARDKGKSKAKGQR